MSLVVPGALDTPTGGYAYDRAIVGELRARGWQVDVHTLGGGFPHPDPGGLADAEALFASLPDGAVVLCDGLAFGAMPGPAERHATRLRLVALVHHPLAAETGLAPARAAALFESERRALATARGVVVTSRSTAAQLADYGVAADRIAVVMPGTAAAPPAQGTRASNPAAAAQLLCVASLVPRKGHAVLVEALHRVRELPWRLTCVGSLDLDPATAREVRDLAGARGLETRIAFPGPVRSADLGGYYDSADVFVLPTFYEGYGMAVAEAVARGLPVVGTCTGALPELVDERNGVLVPPGDLEALTLALGDVIGDDTRRERLAAGARARAAGLPTWPQAAAAMESALLEARSHGVLQR